MEAITERTEDLSQLTTIMVRETLGIMIETGCTLEQAMNCGARWIFDKYPTIAAALVLELQGVAA